MTVRGDVEKISRGIGVLLISLKEEPHGVFVGLRTSSCGELVVSGAFSPNAHSAAAPFWLPRAAGGS
ncbi:hypothetical protein V492_01446 [Pseudogymnoascus sp. VKM F-4246]|nr:hypothetical protein V492_01446 [Pseudogymnoascus sp. VKM F-4246]